MIPNPAEERFWNADAMVEYFARKPADPVIVERLLQLPETTGLRALDLGCGGGRHSEMLAEMGMDVVSVDVNPAMVQFTRNRLEDKGYKPIVALTSIEALGLASDQFDVVVSTGVLHQARSIEQYIAALSEVSRVLKRGGLFTMNIFTNAVWDETYTIPDPAEPYTVLTKEGLWMTLLPKEAFYTLAAEHGLELEVEVAEDIRQENTGARAVLRTHFIKS